MLARIEQWASPDVLTVPLGALFRHDVYWAVYVLEGGVAHLRLVDVAHRNSMVAEIVRGLKPGEDVLLHPNDKVRDGSRVVRRPQTRSVPDGGAGTAQTEAAAR